MTIPLADWVEFSRRLASINNKAAADMAKYIESQGGIAQAERSKLIEYAYGLVTKYGEASGALAAEMYDSIARLSGKSLPPADVAALPGYGEVAKAINGTLKTGNADTVASSVGRLTKRTGADTTLKNAERDSAEFAWIPVGDTCAFCLALASRGWQRMSKKAMKNGHAEHIHANCDCTYAVRFSAKDNVAGYEPDKYLEIYNAAEGTSSKDKINSMRRSFYAENKKAGMLNPDGSVAEEADVAGGRVIPVFTPAKTTSEAEAFASRFTNGGSYSKVDYSGVGIDYANEFNRAMNDVLSQYEPKYKLQNIEPMNMRSKAFKGSTADAAYRWGSNDLFFNKGYFKSEKDFKRHIGQAKELLDQIMPNLDMLIDKYSADKGYFAQKQLAYMQALKATGRTNVSNLDAYGTMVHELGHYLDDTVFRAKMKAAGLDLGESYRAYSKKISAYATESSNEYVAESFLAYWNGESDALDPKLVKIFEEARK